MYKLSVSAAPISVIFTANFMTSVYRNENMITSKWNMFYIQSLSYRN